MSDTGNSFTDYGLYDVNDSLEIFLPDTDIKFEKISSDVFSYYRKNSDGKIIEKMIPVNSTTLKIEVAPIRPLNHPARRTTAMYLEFDKEIYLSEESAATVFVSCPIEIGLFIVHGEHRDSLDFVSCNVYNSRFGLYGSPDTGILCKYSKSQIVNSHSDAIPYRNGIMKILLKNELSVGKSISKIVFTITDNSVYYNEKNAMFDGIIAVLKKRGRTDIIDIDQVSLETDWIQSPTWEPTTTKTHMEMGVD